MRDGEHCSKGFAQQSRHVTITYNSQRSDTRVFNTCNALLAVMVPSESGILAAAFVGDKLID